MSNKRRSHAWGKCVDCDWFTVIAGKPGEWYMVIDDVWAAAGMPAVADLTSYLCVGCIEARLGRQLVAADFTSAEVNDPGPHKTARLLDRLSKQT